MKRSEKILLTLFAIVFLVVIGGGLLSYGIKKYAALGDDTDALRQKLSTMASDIAQGEVWQARAEHVQEHMPNFATAEDAQTKLLELVSKEASAQGLKSGPPEMMPAHVPVEGEDLGFFDKASVKITFEDADEKALFTWMHALQKPDAFIGISRLSIAPSPQGKSVRAEVDLTQFYRQTAPAKLSRAY